MVETGKEVDEQVLAESVPPCESGGLRRVRGRTHTSVASPSSSSSATECTAALRAYTRGTNRYKGECQRTWPYEHNGALTRPCGVFTAYHACGPGCAVPRELNMRYP